MSTFLEKLKKIRENRVIRQTGVYSFIQFFSLGLGFFLNIFLAKQLGAELFGIYSFALAVISFSAIFFECGFFSTAAKILVDTRDENEVRHWLGAFFFVCIVFCLLITAFIAGISRGVDMVFQDKVGDLLLWGAVCSGACLLPSFMELVLKGNNCIYLLSSFNFLQRLAHIVVLAFFWQQDILTPLNILYSFGSTSFLSFLFCYFSLKPRFDQLFDYLRRYITYNASYGWPLYWGRIAGAAAYNIDKLLISYFVDAKAVGFYTIAYSFANPIIAISNALSISSFKRIAVEERIDRKYILWNRWVIFGSCAAVLLLGYATLVIYLPEAYTQSFYYLLLLSVAMIFQGGYGLYNAWLAGHGYAKHMRNIAVCIGVIDVVANVVLIAAFGGYGGCLAAILDMGYSYYLYYAAYHKVTL